MPNLSIRGASLFVEVMGRGDPLLLMHGGPGLDHWSLMPLRELADRFTLVFYDHRCNGRSVGPPVSSMTWENLTADAEALREHLGFERWAVLGHSFGGNVALEYALRHPGSLTHLVLLDTGGDARWPREHAAMILAQRGHGRRSVNAVRRFFTGRFEPQEMMKLALRFLPAYYHRRGASLLWLLAREVASGEWRAMARPEPLIFAGRHLLDGWSVMDRLGEIAIPTLVVAGRDDFLYPPEHQAELAAGIPGAWLAIIERAGHHPQTEQPARLVETLSEFLVGDAARDHGRRGPTISLTARSAA
jgi:proline-specific peptidase